MPIQIRELHIKVVVNAAESPASNTQGHDAKAQAGNADAAEIDKDLIVAECVEQVMSILKDKMEK